MLKNKKILIFQQRNWGIKIGSLLAEKFKNDGAIIGAVTFKYFDYFKKHKNLYTFIQDHDYIQNNVEKFLDGEDFTLKSICTDLGIKSVWPYIQSNRNHVKSYKKKFYYSFQQNEDDEKIINYIKAIYKLIKKIELEFNPDIIIVPNFVSFMHIATFFFAKKKNIKFIGVSAIQSYKDIYFYFVNDVFETQGPIIDSIKLYQDKKKKNLNYQKSKDNLNFIRTNFSKDVKNFVYEKNFYYFKNFIKSILKYFYRFQFFKNIKNTNLQITADTSQYSLYYLFRDYFKFNLNKIKTNKLNYSNIENIKNFVFMTLQFQPEANIDLTSYELNNQIETARQIAMHLPYDYTLVVKDHPQMHGLRTASYLEKISNTPNVKLVHSKISSLEILKKCQFLIGPTGTVFWEAAILKKPSIILGKLGLISMFPNVKKISHFREIPDAIDYFNENKDIFENNSYDEKLIDIISSMSEHNINKDYSKIWNTNYKNENSISEIYDKFKKEITRQFEC
jgi:hypothetical protein